MKEPRYKPRQSANITHDITIFVNHKVPPKLITIIISLSYSRASIHTAKWTSFSSKSFHSLVLAHLFNIIIHFLPTQALPSHLSVHPCLSTTHIFVLDSLCYSLWGFPLRAPLQLHTLLKEHSAIYEAFPSNSIRKWSPLWPHICIAQYSLGIQGWCQPRKCLCHRITWQKKENINTNH